MLNKEQIESLKKQIFSQIDSLQVPDQQKQAMRSELGSKNDKDFVDFLIQNKMIQDPASSQANQPIQSADGSQQTQPPQTQCIFCSIIDEKVPSHKIDENKNSIAILEINPLSNGHSIIIPKEHTKTSEIDVDALKLAKKISKKIKTKLKPENIEISTSEVMGHSIINVIPSYKNKKLEKKQADQKDLEKLKKKLEVKKKPINLDKPKVKRSSKKIEKAPVRIP